MTILQSTTMSLLIEGDDLHWCAVRQSWIDARAIHGEKIEHFLSLPPAAQSLALRSAPPAGRIVLTVPLDWCVLRPVPISVANWSDAREEVAKSIESLIPIPQSEALIGLIGRASKEEEPDSSYLVVIDRCRLNPWTRAIESGLGRSVHMVLSPHMSMLGLGLHDEERAEIVEESSRGEQVIHRLRRGEVDELACAASQLDMSTCARYHLSSGNSHESAEAPREARILSSMQMAEGAALAPRVAPRHFAPLVGRAVWPAPRWVAPSLASLGALACIWLASVTLNARYEAATESIKIKQDDLLNSLQPVMADQTRVDQISQLVENDIAKITAEWRRVLPELEAVHRVLPEDAFLYRVQFDRDALTIRGESARATDVLESLESSALFTKARSLDAPVLVDERGTEQFHIKANRQSLGEESS